MSKADYVRSEAAGDGGDHRHTCHWPGCEKVVPPAMWGCKKHWYRLPQHIRSRIWNAFRPGQEKSKTPSAEYVAAAREAQDWIKQYEEARKPQQTLFERMSEAQKQ